MSGLRRRIVSQPHGAGPAYYHPAGTSATPMIMPLAFVDYDGVHARYHDLHAMPATGDPNAVPLAVTTNGTFGKVVPAGRA